MHELQGQRVVLTRSRDDCTDWAAQLERLGLDAVIFPCIACEIIATPALARTLAEQVARADWLVFTSRRGVETFAKLYAEALPDNIKVAAVGHATAESALGLLGRIDLTGRGGTAAALADELQSALGPASRAKLLLVVAENAGAALEDKLERAGLSRQRVNVYRTVPKPAPDRRTALSTLAADGVFLASPSAVTGFVNQVDIDIRPKLITIGPSTTAAVRALGLDIVAEARSPGLAGLLEAMQCPN